MRIWTLHPRYLDAKGLVALWREALLARAVLRGETRGYRNHPQLQRFRALADPIAGIEAYLAAVLAEADARGYAFDRGKLPARPPAVDRLLCSDGQLDYEWRHLLSKLELRDPAWRLRLLELERPDPHPLFEIVPGPVAEWERVGR